MWVCEEQWDERGKIFQRSEGVHPQFPDRSPDLRSKVRLTRLSSPSTFIPTGKKRKEKKRKSLTWGNHSHHIYLYSFAPEAFPNHLICPAGQIYKPWKRYCFTSSPVVNGELGSADKSLDSRAICCDTSTKTKQARIRPETSLVFTRESASGARMCCYYTSHNAPGYHLCKVAHSSVSITAVSSQIDRAKWEYCPFKRVNALKNKQTVYLPTGNTF